MKVLNSNSFIVKVGDKLEYNQDAIDWINRYANKSDPWPSAEELNKRNPIVAKYEPYLTQRNEKLIELWVEHDDKYTGFSGMVHNKRTDVWCITPDGRCMDLCPYSLFKKRIIN